MTLKSKTESEIQEYIRISTYSKSLMDILIMDRHLHQSITTDLRLGSNKVKVTINSLTRRTKGNLQGWGVNSKLAVRD